MHFKRKLAITATALAAVAFAGGAYAATQDSPGRERQAFLNDVAKRLNVTPQALTAALKGAYIDQLNAAVKAGKLTQAEANALAQRVQNGGPGPFWFGATAPGGGPRFGRPGPAGRHGPLGAAASYLGLTPAQLSSQLRSGKTLAQIATARGKSASGLQQAMMASIKSRLDQAVNAKRISKAQEQQILNTLSTHLSNEINGKRPGGGAPGFFGHPGFFRHLNRGPGGAAGGAGGPGGPGGGAPGGPGGGVPGAPGGPGGGASGAPGGPGGGVPGALFEAPPPPPSA